MLFSVKNKVEFFQFFRGAPAKRVPASILFFLKYVFLFSQTFETRITVVFQNQTLASAFESLRQTNHLRIAYDLESAQKTNISRVELREATVEICFQKLLKNTGFQFEILPSNYVVVKKTANFGKINAPESSISTPVERPKSTICGTVKDAVSGEILPGAFVKIGRQGTTSNEVGYFKVVYSSDVNDSLSIYYIGFKPIIFSLKNKKTSGDCSDYWLSPSENTLRDIVITDRSMAFLSKQNGISKVESRSLGVLPGYGEPDALRMVQVLPGVTTVTDKVNEISLRGGAPDQTLVRWNGIPVYHSSHIYGMISAFNPAAVESISVSKGYFSATETGRIGGIIDLKSAENIPEKSRFSVGANLVSVQMGLILPLAHRKASLLLAARRSFSDVAESVAFRRFFDFTTNGTRFARYSEYAKFDFSKTYKLRAKSYFSDFNGCFIWQPDSSFFWKTSLFFAKDFLKNDFDVRDLANQPTDFGTDSLNLANLGFRTELVKNWNRKWRTQIHFLQTNFEYDFQSFEFQRTRNPTTQRDAQRENLATRQAEVAMIWQPKNAIQVQVGGQINQYDFRNRLAYSFPDLPANDSKYDFRENLTAKTIFFESKWQPSDAVAVEIGGRWSQIKTRKSGIIEPRISGRWQPKMAKSWQFRASGGRFSQFSGQNLGYNSLRLSSEFWKPTNSDQTPPIIYWQFSTGFSFEKNGWLADLEVWAKRGNQLSTINLAFFESYIDDFKASLGKHRARGADFLLRKNFRRASSTLSYGFSRSKFTFLEENNGRPFSAPFEIPHNLMWMQTLKWQRWQASFSWHWRTGQPYSLPAGLRKTSPDSEFYPYFLVRNGGRLPNYQRLDLSLKYAFLLKKAQIQSGIGLFNVYNRRNIDFRYFAAERQKNAAGVEEMVLSKRDRTMLRFTPMLFFLVKI